MNFKTIALVTILVINALQIHGSEPKNVITEQPKRQCLQETCLEVSSTVLCPILGPTLCCGKCIEHTGKSCCLMRETYKKLQEKSNAPVSPCALCCCCPCFCTMPVVAGIRTGTIECSQILCGLIRHGTLPKLKDPYEDNPDRTALIEKIIALVIQARYP